MRFKLEHKFLLDAVGDGWQVSVTGDEMAANQSQLVDTKLIRTFRTNLYH